MKIFGLCCINHGKQMINGLALPFAYHNFDEDGLKSWLRRQQINIDEKYIVDAQPGDTYSFITNHQFIFWRMK